VAKRTHLTVLAQRIRPRSGGPDAPHRTRRGETNELADTRR